MGDTVALHATMCSAKAYMSYIALLLQQAMAVAPVICDASMVKTMTIDEAKAWCEGECNKMNLNATCNTYVYTDASCPLANVTCQCQEVLWGSCGFCSVDLSRSDYWSTLDKQC